MRSIIEGLKRFVVWRIPGQKTVWNGIFRGPADVDVLQHERPIINSKVMDDWVIQTLAMCPSGGRVIVTRQQDKISFEISHPKYIEQGKQNLIEIQVDSQGNPYLYFDFILFETQAYPGFGAVAFYRAAQAAQSAGFSHIELLAAGGKGYKANWTRVFNGYHSWARYGFNAKLWPETKALLIGHPTLEKCEEVLDIIDLDPDWWKKNGDGCDMVFDLHPKGRS